MYKEKIEVKVLEYQKERLTKKYSSYILKVDPYILRLSGYNPHETLLKIDEYYLHCIPATLSLTKCTLLISLAENEIDFFNEFKGSLISLNFSFDPTYFGRSMSFFLKGRFQDLKKMKPGVFILIFSIVAIPDSYKELFFYLSDVVNLYQKLYESNPKINSSKPLVPSPFRSVQIYSNGKQICSQKLEGITINTFKIKKTLQSFEENAPLHFRVIYNNRVIKLSGKLKESSETEQVFSLNFNTEFVYILSRLMNIDNMTVAGGDEAIEELK